MDNIPQIKRVIHCDFANLPGIKPIITLLDLMYHKQTDIKNWKNWFIILNAYNVAGLKNPPVSSDALFLIELYDKNFKMRHDLMSEIRNNVEGPRVIVYSNADIETLEKMLTDGIADAVVKKGIREQRLSDLFYNIKQNPEYLAEHPTKLFPIEKQIDVPHYPDRHSNLNYSRLRSKRFCFRI